MMRVYINTIRSRNLMTTSLLAIKINTEKTLRESNGSAGRASPSSYDEITEGIETRLFRLPAVKQTGCSMPSYFFI